MSTQQHNVCSCVTTTYPRVQLNICVEMFPHLIILSQITTFRIFKYQNFSPVVSFCIASNLCPYWLCCTTLHLITNTSRRITSCLSQLSFISSCRFRNLVFCPRTENQVRSTEVASHCIPTINCSFTSKLRKTTQLQLVRTGSVLAKHLSERY